MNDECGCTSLKCSKAAGNWAILIADAHQRLLLAVQRKPGEAAERPVRHGQQPNPGIHNCEIAAPNPPFDRVDSLARNAPKFDLLSQMFKMCGVDLTRINGIDVTTALAVIPEPGADMNARTGRAGGPSTSCGGTSAPTAQ